MMTDQQQMEALMKNVTEPVTAKLFKIPEKEADEPA